MIRSLSLLSQCNSKITVTARPTTICLLCRSNSIGQRPQWNLGDVLALKYLREITTKRMPGEGANNVSNGTSCAIITEEFIEVAGVPTPILKLGKLRQQNEQNSRLLMLIITGNPGQPGYYEDFMQELHGHSHGQIPVWTIGQAGHVRPPGQSLSLQDVCSTDEKKFGLEAQITHKLRFIQENVPSDVQLVLIGHSIGCYMILNMLDSLPKESVLRCFMLMPTIERMAVSPNGLRMTPVFRYFRWFIVLCAFFIFLIPERIRSYLVHWRYRDIDYPACVHRSILNTLNPWSSNFSSYLAKIEMNKVTHLQKNLVKNHSEKLSMYYGAKDDWAPLQYYYDFRSEFPDVDVRLCSSNLKHAFVMDRKEGQDMARILWQWFETHHFNVLPVAAKKMNGNID